MSEEFRVDGLKELQDKLNQLTDRMERLSMIKALRTGSQVFVNKMKPMLHRTQGATFHTSSGSPRHRHLADDLRIRVRKLKTGDFLSKIGFTKDTAYIARFLEFGTGPHVIKARMAKSLYVPGRGEVAVVDHPGQPARPFMRPAADTESGRALQAFKEELAIDIEHWNAQSGNRIPKS